MLLGNRQNSMVRAGFSSKPKAVGVKPARQHRPQGSVTVILLAFWHPQPATTPVESCGGWLAGNEQVGMRAPGSELGRRGASRPTLAN